MPKTRRHRRRNRSKRIKAVYHLHLLDLSRKNLTTGEVILTVAIERTWNGKSDNMNRFENNHP